MDDNSQNTIVLNEFSTRASDGYCGGSGNFVEIANAGAGGYIWIRIAEKDAFRRAVICLSGSSLAAGKNHNLCENEHDGLELGLSLEEGDVVRFERIRQTPFFRSQPARWTEHPESSTSSVAWLPHQAHRISLTLFNDSI